MKWDSKKIARVAILLAIALILETLSSLFFRMPQGGSISLVMIPLAIIGYMYGVWAGIISGILVGVLQGLFIPPTFINFVQYLLDYILAFGVLGLSSVFVRKEYKVINMELGIVLSYILRYIMHVVSGAIYFGEYAGEQAVILYSMGYNAVTLIPQLVVALILVPIVIKLLKQTKYLK